MIALGWPSGTMGDYGRWKCNVDDLAMESRGKRTSPTTVYAIRHTGKSVHSCPHALNSTTMQDFMTKIINKKMRQGVDMVRV